MTMGLWSVLAILGLLGVFVDHVHGGACGTTTYNATDEIIKLQDPGKGNNCTYFIVAANYTPMVGISFTPVTLDPNFYNLTVYAGNTTDSMNNARLIANLTTVLLGQPFWLVVSRYNVTSLVLSRSNADSPDLQTPIMASYNSTACTAPTQSVSGVFQTPYYLPGNGSVTCVYTGNVMPQNLGVLSFSSLNVSNGSIEIQFGSDSKTIVKGTSLPADSFFNSSTPAVALTVTVNFESDTTPQGFAAVFLSTSPDCSGVITAKQELGRLRIPMNNPLPVLCYTRIDTNISGSQVYLTDAGNYAQTQGLDSIVYYDGNNTKATVLGTLSDDLSWHVSSGQQMTIVASLAPQLSRTTNIQYKADGYSKYLTLNNSKMVIDLDGAKVNGGQVNLVFVSINTSLSYVRFEVNSNSTITDATVTVQCMHAMSLFTFTKDTAVIPVVMPSSPAFAIVKNLGTGQTLSLTVTPVKASDCNQLLMNSSGQILFEATNTTDKRCNILVATGTDLILDVAQVNLCKSGSLDVYQGFNKTASKVFSLTAGIQLPNLAPVRFPSGTGVRLEWKDENYTCLAPTVVGRYWTQDDASTCGSLGTALSGTVSTPNYPNQYPLNVNCTWPVPSTTSDSFLYLMVNTVDFRDGQNITVQQDTTKTLAVVNGTILPGDFMIPNKNLSIMFTSGTAGQLLDPTKSGQGAQLTYKVIPCGGLVTENTGNLSAPDAKNKSVECIWIIQVPANGINKSVNIVNASIMATGYQSDSNGTLDIYDGNSMRQPAVHIDLKSKIGSQVLSRTNTLLVRYAYTNSTSGPFTLKFSYRIYNCNSSSLCDNGICIHPDWRCDGTFQCADGTDEKNCNGSQPIPPTPTPAPHQGGSSSGVPGYWVFISILIGIILGIILTFVVPKCIGKIRRRNMNRSSNYGSLHEDT